MPSPTATGSPLSKASPTGPTVQFMEADRPAVHGSPTGPTVQFMETRPASSSWEPHGPDRAVHGNPAVQFSLSSSNSSGSRSSARKILKT
jgi:hypothetical protein